MSRTRVEPRQHRRRNRGAPQRRVRPPAASLESRIRAFFLTLLFVIATLGIGWLVWSALEWRRGRTASFHVTGLRVVRRSDGRPVGLGRSILRNALCCTVLLVPTILACLVIGLAFVMGASPPSGLLRQPRSAPWDLLTGTEVLDERGPSATLSTRSLERVWPADASVSMN